MTSCEGYLANFSEPLHPNFGEFFKAEVHAGVEVCIAPPRSARTAGEGSHSMMGIMCWCTRTQETAQSGAFGRGFRGRVLRGLIQDPGYGLPRIPLPRTSVNKGAVREVQFHSCLSLVH